jgi:hypothetical protein
MSISDEFRKLQELHDDGVLTEEEFAKAKASVLASLNAPVDENAVRVREQLAQFKTSFANAEPHQLEALLNAAEDLLLFICGEDRYNSFLSHDSNIRRCLEGANDRGQSYSERREWRKLVEERCAELKQRIAGVEYRK